MDLSNLNLEGIILMALKSEIESREWYNKLASKVKNFFLKERLKFLADEEERHRIFFEKLFQEKFPQKTISLPNKTLVPLPTIIITKENLQISKLFTQAMEAEKAAHDFYILFAEKFPLDSPFRKMLLYIAEMEISHYKLLEIEKENAEKFEAHEIEWPMMHIGP